MSKLVVRILFFLFFAAVAIGHITGKPFKLDAIALSLLFVGTLPLLFPFLDRKMLPYLAEKFSSVEVFGLKVALLERKIKEQENVLGRQQEIMQELVVFSMAFYLYDMLKDFKRCERGDLKEYTYRKSHAFENNLRYLRDNGYIEMTFRIAELKDYENIASKIKLTPIGHFYIELRQSFEEKHGKEQLITSEL